MLKKEKKNPRNKVAIYKLKEPSPDEQEKEIFSLLADYSRTLSLLESYDKGKIEPEKGNVPGFIISYKRCKEIIETLKENLLEKGEAGTIFGNENDHQLEGIVNNLYQTFDKKEMYGSIGDKAAHLLYLIIKDHPFTDGNKRIGSFLFVYFLEKNRYLYRRTGERKIDNGALTTLSLLVAESHPKEKDQIVALITQLLK